MKLYHGSPVKGIIEFSKDAPSRFQSIEGDGLYISPDYKIARSYAGSEGSVYEISLNKNLILDLRTDEEFLDMIKKISDKTGIDILKLDGITNTLEGLVSGHYRIRPSGDSGFNWQIKQLLDANEDFTLRNDCEEIYEIIDSYIIDYFSYHDVMIYNDLKLGIVYLSMNPEKVLILKEIQVCTEDEHDYL